VLRQIRAVDHTSDNLRAFSILMSRHYEKAFRMNLGFVISELPEL
jgi:hypothetical protein